MTSAFDRRRRRPARSGCRCCRYQRGWVRLSNNVCCLKVELCDLALPVIRRFDRAVLAARFGSRDGFDFQIKMRGNICWFSPFDDGDERFRQHLRADNCETSPTHTHTDQAVVQRGAQQRHKVLTGGTRQQTRIVATIKPKTNRPRDGYFGCWNVGLTSHLC